METIMERQMTFLGHIYRQRGIEHLVLTGRIPGSKKQGRPRRTLMDNLVDWTGLQSKVELFRAMDSRPHWREMVADAVKWHGR